MNNYDYLDYNGLLYLWQKIKARFAETSSIPTNVSQLTNDSNYQTGTQVATTIANAIGNIETIKFEIVSVLPETGNTATIYLVSTARTNSYDEYIYIDNSWEKIGTTDVDLSGYVQSSDLIAITNSEIDTILAS